jgi:adenine-specific DNA-methyltransferase
MTTKRDRFKELLKTIFQYQHDRISLDFGVYRVFRHKAAEIGRFLETDLPGLVDAEAEKHGVTVEDAYNDILNFFARYYQDGDFYPVPQFGGAGGHILRHHGEETLFSWANRDQYYIKSLTNFSEYRVRELIPENLIWPERGSLFFVIGDVEELKGDQKGQRWFVLNPEKTVTDAEGIRLVFDYRTDKTAQVTPELLQAWLAEKEVELPLEVVTHHLNKFINLRKVDFFIHRRLGEYLREQIDFYVKSELVRLTEPYTLKRALAVQAAAGVVIDFLDRLEELQKRLWEMKKFVFGVGYIITLDRISLWAGTAWLDARLPQILDRQKDEWQALGLGRFKAVDQLKNGGGVCKPLPVDTRLFDEAFKWELLEAIGQAGPLDGLLDGIAVQSDNWQALNSFGARLRDRIKCFYIDPPYNTGTDGFPYKDGYQHSSWLSMIEDRLKAARPLMKQNGAIFVSIDANEQRHLQIALDNAFGPQNRVEEIIWAQNTTKNQSPTYSTNHEYVQVYAKSLEAVKRDERMFREPKPGYAELTELMEKLNPQYPAVEDIEKEIKALFERHKAELAAELEEQDLEYDKNIDMWKGLYNYNRAEYRDADGKLVTELEARPVEAKIWIWREDNPSMPQVKADSQKDEFRQPNHPAYRFYTPLHPKTRKPSPAPKRGWVWPFSRIDGQTFCFEELAADNRIVWGSTEKKVPQVKKFLHEVETQVSKSVVLDYTDGEKELTNLTGKNRSFPSPKPTTLLSRFILQTADDGEWVGDFTFGSGTLAHAVTQAYLADRGRRRFFAVELGEHFEKTALPRVKRVFSAKRWRGGIPAALDGMGLFLKVLKLTSYEETLENCTLRDEACIDVEARLQEIAPFTPFAELYRSEFLSLLPHLVEDSSPALLLNLENDWLTRPFDFTLKTLVEGSWQEQVVDLPETFSLLLGQEVARVKRLEYHGKRRLLVEGSGMVCYWREFVPADIDEEYVRGDMALLAAESPLAGRELFINGIAQNHAKGWLPGNAQETLYTLRALLTQGVAA